MKNLFSHLIAIISILYAFQAQAFQCSKALENKFDSGAVATALNEPLVEPDSQALREAKSMVEAGQNSWAAVPLERLYEEALLDSSKISISEAFYLAGIYRGELEARKEISVLLFILEHKTQQGSSEFHKAAARLSRSYELLGEALDSPQLLENALQVTLKQIELDPENYNTNSSLKRLYLKLGRELEAIEVLKTLYTLSLEQGMPNAPERLLKERIKLLIYNGRLQEAEIALKLELEHDSTKVWALNRLINISLSQKKFTEALDQANQLISIRESLEKAPYAIVFLQKIDALIGLRRFTEAEILATRGLHEFPGFQDKFNAKLIKTGYHFDSSRD